MAAIKLKIDDDAMVEEFFEDTRLLGIVAPQKDYMFIWNVNQLLGFKFRINTGIEIQLKKKGRHYFFNVYEYCMPRTTVYHYLYENQHDGEYLLPEFKHLDFLWLIKNCEMTDSDFTELQRTIKKVPTVQFVNEMTNEKIKNKKHMIF